MARGGFRPGAGRPVGAKTGVARKPRSTKPSKPKIVRERKPKEMKAADLPDDLKVLCDPNTSPLDFLLTIMRDNEGDTNTRMRAAAIAAPFCHAKAGEKGKKDERKDAAEKAASGKFATPMAPKLAIV